MLSCGSESEGRESDRRNRRRKKRQKKEGEGRKRCKKRRNRYDEMNEEEQQEWNNRQSDSANTAGGRAKGCRIRTGSTANGLADRNRRITHSWSSKNS